MAPDSYDSLCSSKLLSHGLSTQSASVSASSLTTLQVRAVYAFDAEAEGELSVAVGDRLWVETEVDGWYQVVRDGDGARGLVPSSYVDVEQL